MLLLRKKKPKQSCFTGLWNPKERGTVVWFTFGTIFCKPDGKMFAEKPAFCCLVTWGMRRRVLSCSLAASNYCTACNKQGRQLQTPPHPPPHQFGWPSLLYNRGWKLTCLAWGSATQGASLGSVSGKLAGHKRRQWPALSLLTYNPPTLCFVSWTGEEIFIQTVWCCAQVHHRVHV